MGNIYAKRDWGYAGDYVRAMWMMMQRNVADDYVVATNKTYSIKDFINEAAQHYNIKLIWRGKGESEHAVNTKDNKIIIKIDPKFFRPAEVDYLRGNPNKVKKNLKWKPTINFKKLVEMMSKADIKRMANSL